MKHSTVFDLIVIGSGPGGYRAAVKAALRGLSVAIVEKAQWGGCCLNRGCVPKKAWHHMARTLSRQHTLQQLGINGHLTLDRDLAWQHQRQLVSEIQQNYRSYLSSLKVTSFDGEASFQSSESVLIDHTDGAATEIFFKNCIIAIGSRPAIPEGIDASHPRILTTDDLFENPLPAGDRLGLLGSGVVATELAFILSNFGYQFDWFSRSPMLSRGGFSPSAMGVLRELMNNAGLAPRQYKKFTLAKLHEHGLQLKIDDETIDVDGLLLATGRQVDGRALRLENAGVQQERGYIAVNENLRTANDKVWAIGDCVDGAQTANQAIADAELVVDNLFASQLKIRDELWVPQVVYTIIEMARLGVDDDRAEDLGHEPAVGFASFSNSPQAMGELSTDGFVRLLADLDDGYLLGAEVLGEGAGELIQMISAAVATEGVDKALHCLQQTLKNHPSRSEEISNAVETLISRWGINN